MNRTGLKNGFKGGAPAGAPPKTRNSTIFEMTCKLFSKRWSYAAYLIGGILFLVGAGRLLARNDAVGAVILAIAACLALLLAAADYARRNGGPK